MNDMKCLTLNCDSTSQVGLYKTFPVFGKTIGFILCDRCYQLCCKQIKNTHEQVTDGWIGFSWDQYTIESFVNSIEEILNKG